MKDPSIPLLARLAVLLFMALVSACTSLDEHSWVKPGADEAKSSTDLAACREYARSEVKTQSDIDQDIAASSSDPYGPAMGGATDFSTVSTEQRYRSIVNQCMLDLGYQVAR